MWDIIPDIHGHAGKLIGLLKELGYTESKGAWRHSDPNRIAVFLGDFIDRGPDNAKVIRIVRSMIDAGTAQAIMGNHELNAIHFHTLSDATGLPLRVHSTKNVAQHASFLAEHSLGGTRAQDAVHWMRNLPIFLELDRFRAVHACWSHQSIQSVLDKLPNGTLTEEAVQWSADMDHPLFQPIETLTKGPEAELPEGYWFKDKGGHERGEVRLAWWKRDARTWKEIAILVPDAEKQLPNAVLPASISSELYPTDAKPVFFGHYWMTGQVMLQAPNALCLDYSAGLGGPLLAYTFEEPGAELDLGRVTAFGG